MKRLFIVTAIAGFFALTATNTSAQVNLNVNIGTQPAWVPVGYQNVNYYYLPEVHSYYSVPQREFVYLNGDRWTRSRLLPARYRGYDLNRGRKVVVYGNRPYHHYRTHRLKYSRDYRREFRTERPGRFFRPGPIPHGPHHGRIHPPHGGHGPKHRRH